MKACMTATNEAQLQRQRQERLEDLFSLQEEGWVNRRGLGRDVVTEVVTVVRKVLEWLRRLSDTLGEAEFIVAV
uniref:Uncharacterized protein n=1 Tax=Chromera velia CCMP2878 TaxID=1169474 RepID=A0A0G4G943_9ALVE|eukprot:Cvel_589.t1-p1 / transcript=Cvel_589.t1 / gene=Cvel_589 / organism=Chromera_velia_CCMP2878 / gene_product=hypothetical protein / transcript_product=hypothetical protein / location=Cvel_scaffold18:92106-92324(-) / protein_length=73 / sequence_SO=supercontig / SO=protein_coding / is_pseudo=false